MKSALSADIEPFFQLHRRKLDWVGTLDWATIITNNNNDFITHDINFLDGRVDFLDHTLSTVCLFDRL